MIPQRLNTFRRPELSGDAGGLTAGPRAIRWRHSLSVRQTSRAVSVAGVVLAVIGLAATALSTAAGFAGTSLYLGLGAGGMERIAGYPASLWLLMTGIMAVLSLNARTPGTHRSPLSS